MNFYITRKPNPCRFYKCKIDIFFFFALVHVNGFFALGQDRKDLKWKSLAAVGISNDKTVNWNEHLLTKLLPVVYMKLFHFMKSEKDINLEDYYGAWPDESTMDPKWKPVLKSFYNLMQQSQFLYVSYQKRWYLPSQVWFLQRSDMNSEEFEAVKIFLRRVNIPYVVVPTTITNNLPMNLRWLTNYHINQFIIQKPNVYTLLSADTQCNLLSYSLKDESDLKTLINGKVFPLKNGTMFQLLKRNSVYMNASSLYYLTTDEIPSSVLPTTERCLDENFFKSNPSLLKRLKKMLVKGNIW